jgi:hypothetical protein
MPPRAMLALVALVVAGAVLQVTHYYESPERRFTASPF